jgi:hypothetical protein
MPGFDRTGPRGEGARTGGGFGYCGGSAGGVGFGPGRGGRQGLGMGGGRGLCRGRGARWGGRPGGAYDEYQGRPGPQDEKEDLKAQAESLRNALENLEKRLTRLEAGPDGSSAG